MLEFVSLYKDSVEVRCDSSFKIGTLIKFRRGWEIYFKLPISDSSELRQIADKLDELNGVKNDKQG